MQKLLTGPLFQTLEIICLCFGISFAVACSSTRTIAGVRVGEGEIVAVTSATNQEQADAHFALGEAYSLDSQRPAALEEFRSALIYDNSSITIRLRLATELVRANQVDLALHEIDTVLESHPDSADAYLLRGGVYANDKKFNEAKADYTHVTKLDPTKPEGWLYLGAIAAEIPDDALAEKAFLKLASLPTYTSTHLAWFYLGKIYFDEAGVQKKLMALKAFEKAQSLKPNDEDIAMAIAKTEIALGHKDLALKKLIDFSKSQSCEARVYELIGDLSMEVKDTGTAEDAYTRIELDPELGLSAKLKLAGIYLASKNLNHGLELLEELALKIPDSDRIQYFLGTTYENRAQTEKAIFYYKRIDSTSSFLGDATVHLAYLLRGDNQLSNAVDVTKAALEARKDLPQLYALYSQLLEAAGDHEKSLLVVEAGMDSHPQNSQLEFFGALALEKNGKLDEGIALMNQLIKREPNHVQALNYVAFAYAEKGTRLPEAEKLIQRALTLQPEDAFLLDTLGWVEFKLGNTSKATIILEKAHQKEPLEPVIAEHLGDIYTMADLPLKAHSMYELALDKTTEQGPAREALAQKVKTAATPARLPATSVP